MEKELVELYEAVKKAADAASSADGEAEESRCLDALELLKQFPVNYQNLVSTQVGKHLKLLTKHPRKKIRALATDLIEIWKRVIIKETSKNKNGNSENHVGSTNVDTVEAEKVQRTPSIKLEKVSKLETIKVEKIEANGISRSDKARKVEVDVIKINSVKKTSSSPAAPPKLTSMIESKDAMRDKIRELLREALSRVYKEAEGENVEEVNVCDPIRVAVTVESVLFEEWGPSNGAQKVKYRSLMFNLKDPKNPDFRRKVLLGEVKPERLLNMTTEEMASDQRQQEIHEIKKKALFECERGQQPKATTNEFKCGRCGQRKCTYYQMQTRSADEPMTTYVTCVNCNNRWKFC